MATIEKAIDVEVPARTAYDQWTQFEEFPTIMEGVERVVSRRVQSDLRRFKEFIESRGRETARGAAKCSAPRPMSRDGTDASVKRP